MSHVEKIPEAPLDQRREPCLRHVTYLQLCEALLGGIVTVTTDPPKRSGVADGR